MTKDNEANDAVERDQRAPYEPPAIVSEEVFETLALACGKQAGDLCELQGGLRS